MARVKRGTKRRARRKKYAAPHQGFFPHQEQALPIHAGGRQSRRPLRLSRPPHRKRQYRQLWIQRIGAAARLNGLSYSQLMHGLKAAGVEIDRKMLADMAVKDAGGFARLAAQAKAASASGSPPRLEARAACLAHGERPDSEDACANSVSPTPRRRAPIRRSARSNSIRETAVRRMTQRLEGAARRLGRAASPACSRASPRTGSRPRSPDAAPGRRQMPQRAARARRAAPRRTAADASKPAAEAAALARDRVDLSLPGVARARSARATCSARPSPRSSAFSSRWASRVVEGPGDRDALLQLRGAQHPRASSRARHHGHVLSGDAAGAPQPHLLRTHTSPMQVRTMEKQAAAGAHHRAGQGLSPRQSRRHALLHVPPGRRPGRGHRHHLLRIQRHGRIFRARISRARRSRRACGPAISRSPSLPSKWTRAASSAAAAAAACASIPAGSSCSARAWWTRRSTAS